LERHGLARGLSPGTAQGSGVPHAAAKPGGSWRRTFSSRWAASPATAGLDLQNAGVETDFGRIVTNAAMQTSAPHIYAAGDCTGPHQIVHIAVEQGEIAAHNIAHPSAKAEHG
jgi:NADPH-dependent glutamate synthase beta subunit-like oxidoreductase